MERSPMRDYRTLQHLDPGTLEQGAAAARRAHEAMLERSGDLLRIRDRLAQAWDSRGGAATIDSLTAHATAFDDAAIAFRTVSEAIGDLASETRAAQAQLHRELDGFARIETAVAATGEPVPVTVLHGDGTVEVLPDPEPYGALPGPTREAIERARAEAPWIERGIKEALARVRAADEVASAKLAGVPQATVEELAGLGVDLDLPGAGAG